ncbi:uncharacterized protein N7518_004439, partial [Penicillium psychrosexuale]|uniref:uncharacterized protein n=1 Tax=Penicillium psychrosexuale TaxID=1002107 RepID=UPI002545B671
MGLLGDRQQIHFSAENDECEISYQPPPPPSVDPLRGHGGGQFSGDSTATEGWRGVRRPEVAIRILWGSMEISSGMHLDEVMINVSPERRQMYADLVKAATVKTYSQKTEAVVQLALGNLVFPKLHTLYLALVFRGWSTEESIRTPDLNMPNLRTLYIEHWHVPIYLFPYHWDYLTDRIPIHVVYLDDAIAAFKAIVKGHLREEAVLFQPPTPSRLGLPLVSFKEKWQSLRQVPPSTCAASSEVTRAGGRRLKRLQYLAQEYFASNRGADNAGPNIGFHNCLNQVLKGVSYPKEKVQQLTEITAYRLGAMYETRLLARIGLQFPSIFDIDPEDALGNLPEKHLTLKTWSLLLSHDINTTPCLTFLLLKMECQK